MRIISREEYERRVTARRDEIAAETGSTLFVWDASQVLADDEYVED
jgi:hypothetical protein